MRVIPVLDLKDGLVVAAVFGERHRYRAIQTPLAPGSSQPADVAAGLIGLWRGFDTLYIADLDAIGGSPANTSAIASIAARFPLVRLIVDAGPAWLTPDLAGRLSTLANVIPVIGTESLTDAEAPRELNRGLGPGGWILSLDRRKQAPVGPPAIWQRPGTWPDTVIVLTLDRVGSRGGPDLETLAEVKRQSGAREVLCGGGVRDREDLEALRLIGCGALLATSLHDGSLTAADLEALAKAAAAP